MAKSLKNLVEYLLGEVALYGNRGASVTDVLGFIDDFYAAPAQPAGAAVDVTARKPNLDRRFKSKVWSWLTRHPEVSVGKDREGNGLDLDEMEARCRTNDAVESFGTPGDASLAPDGESTTAPQVPLKRMESQYQSELRVFVSEERMWLAIAGHSPDFSRIVPLQFALLSIIASQKSKGIMHPELCKLSGQDKRSVPKRTDVLQEKGYIAKKPVQYKSIRTTLCTLRKFAGASAPEATTEDDNMVDLTVLLDKLIDVLRQFDLITLSDLWVRIGIRSDPWRRKVARRAIRKLESIGCVRRVRALSQFSNVNKTRYVALMLTREPTDQDRQAFDDRRQFTSSSLEHDDADELDAAEEEQADAPVDQEGTMSQHDLGSKPDIEEVGRVVPQWTPGTSLQNHIIRIIDQSGTKGMTSLEISDAIMGAFCRKAITTSVYRLMESLNNSQPLHLRHLLPVRDATLRGTIYSYLHYTLRNFTALVERGQASWDAIESGVNDIARRAYSEAEPELDDYGFPAKSVPPGLVKGGHATLRECLEVVKPDGYRPTPQDPVAVKLCDGTYRVGYSSSAWAKRAMRRAIDMGDDVSSESTPGKRRRSVQFVGQEVINGGELVDFAMPPPKRRKKEKVDPYAGMTEKERLAAQGYDESWTEYSVLCLERPAPGLYLTPFGRRRPVGKARGRPPKSRVAVFKLPKLQEFDWFVRPEEAEVLPDAPEPTGPETEAAEAAAENIREAETPTPTPRPKRTRRKSDRASAAALDYRERSESDIDVLADAQEPTSESPRVVQAPPTGNVEQTGQQPPRRGRPPKKRRKVVQDDFSEISADREQNRQSQDVVGDSSQVRQSEEVQQAPELMEIDDHVQLVTKSDNAVIVESRNEVSTARQDDAEPIDEDELASVQTITQQPGQASPPVDREPPRDAAEIETVTIDSETQVPSVETPVTDSQGDQLRTSPDLRSPSQTGEATAAEMDTREARSSVKPERQSVDIPATGEKKPKRASNRSKLGGSVAMARKQIIMDIVQKSGGIYPMGREIWYPFTTAWIKRKYKERPDMKTLRSTVGALVETGKLRQYTFTGRNPKGAMVTKSLVTAAELEAGDQRITDLQTAMLNADPGYYFPPGGPEIDETLRKSHAPTGPRPEAQETDVTVTLHQTPKKVHRLEGIAARSMVRERMRGSGFVETRQPVHRLESVKRPPPRNEQQLPPQQISSTGQPLITVWRHQKRAMLETSRFIPNGLSMVMEPQQVFNAATGTFGTVIPKAKEPGYLKWSLNQQPPKTSLLTRTSLPESLGDILSESRRRPYAGRPLRDKSSAKFFDEVDRVRRWEKWNDELLTQPNNNAQLTYIHHEMPGPFQTAPLEAPPEFAADALPRAPSQRPVIAPVTTRAAHAQREQSPTRIRQYQQQHPSAPRPVAQRVPKTAADRTGIIRRQRQPRAPNEIRNRLLVAIVVVRTLGGGRDGRMIDWPIIAGLFPDYTLQSIVDHGRLLVNRNRLQLAKMQDDFRERFADAYEASEVPPLDFNNLESYDWDWVVSWAEEQLETPREQPVPSLPSTREQFDNLFEIRAEPPQELDEIYQLGTTVTIPRKQALLSNTSFAIPVKSPVVERPDASRMADAEQLKSAKTWIRANLLTSEESYNPAEASQILGRFGSNLLDRAVTSLMAERALIHSNKGRVTPGRNYAATDHFLYTLGRKRSIEPAQLKRAAEFKTNFLDEKLRTDGKYAVEYGAEDGDILTIMNLADEGRVRLAPRDPPRKKFGLTDFGYQTRKIDRAKLRFTIDVTPVEGAYVYGNPVRDAADHTPIPRGEMDLNAASASANVSLPPPGKIPLWFDVHGQVMIEWWNAALCAVLGTLAIRPGMGAEGIANMLQPCLGGWEVELVLEWLRQVGVVQHTRDDDTVPSVEAKWMLKDWWWMVVK